MTCFFHSCSLLLLPHTPYCIQSPLAYAPSSPFYSFSLLLISTTPSLSPIYLPSFICLSSLILPVRLLTYPPHFAYPIPYTLTLVPHVLFLFPRSPRPHYAQPFSFSFPLEFSVSLTTSAPFFPTQPPFAQQKKTTDTIGSLLNHYYSISLWYCCKLFIPLEPLAFASFMPSSHALAAATVVTYGMRFLIAFFLI